MFRFRSLVMALGAFLMLGAPMVQAQAATPAPSHKDIRIAYVLHGLNAFTGRMKTGAEDAAKDYGVTLDVFGDASFDTATHQAFFESAIQSGYNGIAVVTNPGSQWITPIQEAIDAKIPLVGANVTGLETGLTAWVGQDEYNSGVILGGEMKKKLEAAGVTKGTIVMGLCTTAAQVIVDRYNGFKKAMEGTGFEVSQQNEVLIPVPDNYSRWENLATANPDAVAMVGLCSIDIPNLAQLKERNKAKWLVGGYDLDGPTLEAIKAGTAVVTVGQQEYLQGYLPVRALAEHLINGTPMVAGWLECPTEIVDATNVAQYVGRQTDNAQQYAFYKDYMAKNFADLQKATRPYDDLKHPGMAKATPAS